MDDFLKDMVVTAPETVEPPPLDWSVRETPAPPEGKAWWVPEFSVPEVGQEVNILAWRESAADKGIRGTVIGYQVCHGYLMIWVKPDARPRWHQEQNPGRWAGLFAGIELEPV